MRAKAAVPKRGRTQAGLGIGFPVAVNRILASWHGQ